MNIIITGASSGIGYATANILANKGHNIIAIARSAEKLKTLTHPNIHTIEFDLAIGNILEGLLPQILILFKDIHALINNAGMLINKPFEDTTLADFDTQWRINVTAPAMLIQALIPYLASKSHVVNMGSMGGYAASSKFAGLAAYSTTKGALATLTECLAEELKDKHIAVNCLALGAVQTDMLAKAFPGYVAPLTANEAGEYIADFTLNGHKYFNGKVLPVSVATP